MFHGSMVALVTPMTDQGAIDIEDFTALLDWHVANHTDAIIVLGTTGESPTVNPQERDLIIQTAIKQVAGKVPVIIGTGANATRETIHLTRQAMEMGADGCLVVTPYYNKPTQEGLYQHFKAVAEAVAIPQILYNVPSRTGVDLLPETVARLAGIPNIIGIKEATGNVSRVGQLLSLCNGKMDLYSGDDLSALDFMLAGGKGVISVIANVVPKDMYEMCRAALSGHMEEAKRIYDKLLPLNKALVLETNPIPAKWALHEMGMISPGIRLPLTPFSEDKRSILREAMQRVHLF